MAFAKPATSEGIKWKTLKGALLLIEPLEFQPGIATSFGETSAVRANVHVIDGDAAGEVFADTLIFPKMLQTAVKNSIGGQVLGRLGQGVAKANQSPPWVLEDSTGVPADVSAAEAYLAATTETPF